MANLALLDPSNYVNWFMTEFPDVQDNAGRSFPVTGASPAVRTYDDTTGQVSAALAGTRPSERAQSGQSTGRHAQLLALALVVGVILTILLLGLVAFRVQVAVR